MFEHGRYLSMMGFSTLGGYQTLMTAIVLGGAVCFAGAPEDVLQVIALYHVTHLIAAPFQVRTLLESQAKSGLHFPSLRQVVLAGSHMPNSLLAEVRQQLCPNVICAYGSTELGPVAFGPAAAMRGIEGATGFVMPGQVIEIVDPNGTLRPPGEQGIVRIKSEHIDRYFVPTPEDAEIFKDGYFYPGDLGIISPDGRLALQGRVTEVINISGIKVPAGPIEETLQAKFGASGACVFSTSRADGEEILHVVFESPQRFEPAEVVAVLRGLLPGTCRGRTHYVDDLPRNDMGKIRRDVLKAQLAGKLE